jgi:hypothetical protein
VEGFLRGNFDGVEGVGERENGDESGGLRKAEPALRQGASEGNEICWGLVVREVARLVGKVFAMDDLKRD